MDCGIVFKVQIACGYNGLYMNERTSIYTARKNSKTNGISNLKHILKQTNQLLLTFCPFGKFHANAPKDPLACGVVSGLPSGAKILVKSQSDRSCGSSSVNILISESEP